MADHASAGAQPESTNPHVTLPTGAEVAATIDGASSDGDVERMPWLKSYPAELDWHAAIEPVPMGDFFDHAVRRWGDRAAFDFLGRTWSYTELGEMADRAAKGFQDLGIEKGTRVGLFLPNCPWFPVCYFGLLKIGAIVVNFNPLYAEREVEKQVKDAGVDTMVTLDLAQLVDKLATVMDKTDLKRLVVASMAKALPFPKSLLFAVVKAKEIAKFTEGERFVRLEKLMDNDGKYRPAQIDPVNDIGVLQYTGGTTGVPKGAMLTHANLSANVEQASRWFIGAKAGEEVMMAVLPFFHVFAMTSVMNMGLGLGCKIVALPRFEIMDLMKAVKRTRPTLFAAVPTIYTAINHFKDRGKYGLDSIKMCISGGAPLPVEVKRDFERLTGCVLFEGYGLTESAPVACCNPVTGENKPASIGMPVPGTMIEIASLDDPDRILPRGETGEICITGPQIMKGYWRNDEATAETIRNGRLHTGDVGYIDEDGYVFIVDRIKDMILAGGYNVYPRNVEEAIYLHPAVEECVVGGVPDEYRGQTVKAWIKLKDGKSLDKADLKSFLKDKLSPIEQPKIVEFRDEPLPKTLIGKLSRKDLVDEEKARHEQAANTP